MSLGQITNDIPAAGNRPIEFSRNIEEIINNTEVIQ